MTCRYCGEPIEVDDLLHQIRCDGRQGRWEHYPVTAGWTAEGPSHEAAETIDAATVRTEVLRWLRMHGPVTADEAANALGYTPFTIRPRFTELKALGFIQDSGDRRKNSSGRRATVWTLKAVS